MFVILAPFEKIFDIFSYDTWAERVHACGSLLTIFIVYENFGIPKTEIFNFCGTGRVKQNKKQINISQNQVLPQIFR